MIIIVGIWVASARSPVFGTEERIVHTTIKHYDQAADYERVGRFLLRTYGAPVGAHINWMQPRWEYMHYHPFIRDLDLSVIGVWEADGEIVGVAHPEHSIGTAYFEIHPDHAALKGEMLRYAEEHISAESDGLRRLRVYINDQDEAFQRLASERGYGKGSGSEPMSHFDIPDPFPPISLRTGFRLKSLAEDNDLPKVDRVLWRGFDHGDEPPADGIADREFMQSAPNYRHDLNVVVEAPNGNFVSYCGMWYEPVHRVAYVEPVATDPDYRRRGLGSAAVLEGIRRCGALGATVACVGSDQPFYLSLGFRPVYNRSIWQREWAV
ncbi:MAG: GNAT family N-acetyltransferase [Chloroflexota bacterium]|nr:GNAT family N-acetyltransferase [Chloroflexota bacterium]